ncbi:MAG: type 3 dihydrofolate reductase [Candidatus Saccharimonadales bacterium]
MIRLIAAIDRKRGLSKCGYQPWKIPDDERYFNEMTRSLGATIVMGRKTYETIGRLLPDRHIIVATKGEINISGVDTIHSLEAYLSSCEGDLWIIGGASIYQQALSYADELYVTHIDADFGCDLFFPEIPQLFQDTTDKMLHEQNGFIYHMSIYSKIRTEVIES